MRTVLWNVRTSARFLWRNRAVSSSSIVTTVIVVAISAVILRLPWAVLMSPLPYAEPDRLVMVWLRDKVSDPHTRGLVPAVVFLDWTRRQQFFSDIAAVELWDGNQSAHVDLLEGRPTRLRGAFVTPNFFAVLGVKPALGSGFQGLGGNIDTVLISDRLWRTEFRGDPQTIGKTVRMVFGRGKERVPRPVTIVGILPKGVQFSYPAATDVWFAFRPTAMESAVPDALTYQVIARLKPGIPIARADAGIRHMVALPSAQPGTAAEDTAWVEPMTRYVAGDVRRPLLLLAIATLALMLIGALNIAMLQLVLVDAYHRNACIQLALGATPARLILQYGCQACLVIACGGALGVAVSLPLVGLLRYFLPQSIPRADDVSDIPFTFASSVVFLVGVVVVATVVAWSRPARVNARWGLLRHAEGQDSGSKFGLYRHAALLCVQLTLLFPLLTCAGLTLVSSWRLRQTDLGFEPRYIFAVWTRVLAPQYFEKGSNRMGEFRERWLTRVRQSEGVLAATTASAAPFGGIDWVWSIRNPTTSTRMVVNGRQVDPLFFDVMGIPLVAGRPFSDADQATSPSVTVISRAVAQKMFPNGDALGKEIVLNGRSVVVGIVGDVQYGNPWETPRPAVYVPVQQRETELISMLIKSRLRIDQIETITREAAVTVDPSQPFEPPVALVDALTEVTAERTFVSVLTAFLAGVAIVLATAAVFGSVARRVAKQRRAIAIRAVLGASPWSLSWFVAWSQFLPVILGVAAGWALTYRTAVIAQPLLYATHTRSVEIYSLVAILVMLIGSLAILAGTTDIRRSRLWQVLRE